MAGFDPEASGAMYETVIHDEMDRFSREWAEQRRLREKYPQQPGRYWYRLWQSLRLMLSARYGQRKMLQVLSRHKDDSGGWVSLIDIVGELGWSPYQLGRARSILNVLIRRYDMAERHPTSVWLDTYQYRLVSFDSYRFRTY